MRKAFKFSLQKGKIIATTIRNFILFTDSKNIVSAWKLFAEIQVYHIELDYNKWFSGSINFVKLWRLVTSGGIGQDLEALKVIGPNRRSLYVLEL